jgi:hypothetical protein
MSKEMRQYIEKFNKFRISENLNISDVSDSSIDITEIIENGDRFERSFFQWLNDNKIGWYQKGSDLNYIQLFDKKNDFSKIKQTWKEVK